MTNIIEYLLLNLVIMFFLNNSLITFIYGICVVLIGVIYSLIYYRNYRKLTNEEKNQIKSQISVNFIMMCLMILVSNLIYNIGIFNLIYGLVINAYFIIKYLIKLIKKDLLNNKKFLNANYTFDLYSVFYLTCLLIQLLKYEI